MARVAIPANNRPLHMLSPKRIEPKISAVMPTLKATANEISSRIAMPLNSEIRAESNTIIGLSHDLKGLQDFRTKPG